VAQLHDERVHRVKVLVGGMGEEQDDVLEVDDEVVVLMNDIVDQVLMEGLYGKHIGFSASSNIPT